MYAHIYVNDHIFILKADALTSPGKVKENLEWQMEAYMLLDAERKSFLELDAVACEEKLNLLCRPQRTNAWANCPFYGCVLLLRAGV